MSIEPTKRPAERVPFGQREDKASTGTTAVDEVASAAVDEGVYVANAISTLTIAPSLPVTQADIDEAEQPSVRFETFDTAIAILIADGAVFDLNRFPQFGDRLPSPARTQN